MNDASGNIQAQSIHIFYSSTYSSALACKVNPFNIDIKFVQLYSKLFASIIVDSVSRVRFNNSWFVFHDSSWSFHKPYSCKKHFTNCIGWTEHTTMVLKPTSRYQIIWHWDNSVSRVLFNDSWFVFHDSSWSF